MTKINKYAIIKLKKIISKGDSEGMVVFKSDYSDTELIKRWDEYTSPARFAGSDDSMDLIFVSKRKNNKVKLVRRARSSREPFSSVFRGKIVKTEAGSEIRGIFTKSIVDYLTVFVIMAFLFYIRNSVIARDVSPKTISLLIAVTIIGAVLLLINLRGSKRIYADFICRITGTETDMFRSRRESKDDQDDQS